MEIFILDLAMAVLKLFSSETTMVNYMFVETMERKTKKNKSAIIFIKNAEQTNKRQEKMKEK